MPKGLYVVRNDLTLTQQHQLTKRITRQRKVKEIRTIAQGRGRHLKAKEFPELAVALEYAFGELDVQGGGGGLEAHPRLTTGTLYRGAGNATTMHQAREIVLAMAPEGFRIALSSCYNYTENCREGTEEAVRHQAGRNVNAKISLRKPPRVGVEQLVLNLHWSTCNVNNIIDIRQANSVVISKDAKACVAADIPPVQMPGHSWRSREYPDHTWDQSRTNQITPMTFLFLETKVTGTELHGLDRVQHITRTGQVYERNTLSTFITKFSPLLQGPCD